MPRKPSGKDEGTAPVRIESGIALQAKIAAEAKGMELSAYLSDLLRSQVAKDWAKARKQILDA